MARPVAIRFAPFVFAAVAAAEPRAGTERGIDNLAAFGRLFGYVRFFHPSDGAAAADWDAVAIGGVEAVEDARGAVELARRLERMFRPLAPTVQVFPTASAAPPSPVTLEGGDRFTAWRHCGVGLAPDSMYRSARVDTHPPRRHEWHDFLQQVEAKPVPGEAIVLRAWARSEMVPGAGEGRLVLMGGATNGLPGTKLADVAIEPGELRPYEVRADVSDRVDWVGFGVRLHGTGRIIADDVEVTIVDVRGRARPVPYARNLGFEDAGPEGAPEGWLDDVSDGRYRIERLADVGRTGAAAAFVSAAPAFIDAVREPLVVHLPGGVTARVPLSLPADASGTLPRATAAPAPAPATAGARTLRLAGVILAWNVFQHFYPYFDDGDTGFAHELPRALAAAARAPDDAAYVRTLELLLAALHDGHARVASEGGEARLPVLWDVVEGELVVLAAGTDVLHPGDVIETIDGAAAVEAMAAAAARVSGATEQWIRARVLGEILPAGSPGSGAVLGVERDDARFEVRVRRDASAPLPEEPRPESVAEVAPGIHYVDLTHIDDATFDRALPTLRKARGIVFDVRGYPGSVSTKPISHLIDAPVQSPLWCVPIVTRPDREGMTFGASQWTVYPAAPRLAAKAAFLMDGRAISYAETFLGIIEHHRIAELVGSPTAGTNGNVNPFTLPGNYRLFWTGMKVHKQDGSRHHGVGIQPTVPVVRTRQGIALGRDEVLDRAIALLSR